MSSSQYTYDTSGQSYFFALTVLLSLLLPATYLVLNETEKRSYEKPGASKWNEKAETVTRTSEKPSRFKTRYVLLALAWALLALVVQQALYVKNETKLYDPFEVLGLSTSATEKEIKKHYKRLSLQFHPDKVQVAEDQTKEEVESHFVDLTKAYKALTDEDTRKNFELYGHPDGKQEFTQGIALPSWVVEENYRWIMIAVYTIGLGVVLPYVVSRWWSKSSSVTKDKILLSTAAHFFHSVDEKTDYGEMMDILASADEFKTHKELLALRKRQSSSKTAQKEYEALKDKVLGSVDVKIKNAYDDFDSWPEFQQRARVLTAAYLLRLDIQDASLLQETFKTVELSLLLSSALASLLATSGLLSPYLCALHIRQYLSQGIHPTHSQFLQLPDVSGDDATALHSRSVHNVPLLLTTGTSPGLSDASIAVARLLPRLVPVEVKLGVRGEKLVTPGSLVHGEISFSQSDYSAPSRDATTSSDDASSSSSYVQVEKETPVKQISIGFEERLVFTDDIETPKKTSPTTPTMAHTPRLPINLPTSFVLFVGDHKSRRTMMAPVRFTSTSSVEFEWQAPPNPGLYTFQLYLVSENYVGLDVQIGIRMLVRPPAEDGDDEDDISDPEEDSIAGQLAIMRGQNVKRAGDDSDLESESEDTDTDTDTDTSDDD